MTIDQIHYFLSVVNQGSINKASVAMNISQQSLSSSMRALEEEVGAALFRRSNRGVTLTEEGRVFHEFAVETWAGYARMDKRLHPKRFEDSQKRLRVGTVDALTTTFLPAFLIDYENNHPYVHLQVFNEPLDELLERVHKKELDCALVFQLTSKDKVLLVLEEPFVNLPLAVCKNYCWVSTRSPLALHQSVSLKQVAEGPILVKDGTDVNFSDALYEGYEVNIFDFPLATDMHMMSEIVANNMAICPDVKVGAKELTMARMFASLPVVAVPVRMPSFMHVDVHLVEHKKNRENSVAEQFIHALMRYAGSRV